MFTVQTSLGWLGITPLLGIFLSIILGVMVICSLKFVRRGGHFEVFYLTHLLYIVFYILLILHARNFWHWLIGPAFIFVLEKICYLYKCYSTGKGKTLLHSAIIEQGKVVKLIIYRPSGFHFMPGDYVLLNIPQIAWWEWHPFTLTSAPEDQEFLTVHIQSAGNWTGKVFDRYKQLANARLKTLETDLETAPLERILVDGPYTTCARYVFKCSHAILIGAGIGKCSNEINFGENRYRIIEYLSPRFSSLHHIIQEIQTAKFLKKRLISCREKIM
jgi:predicted ferric reductase